MDSVAVTVPLRPPTKKMKKRKELDALAPSHVISRRTSGKRSSQELLTDSSDERSEYWNVSIRGNRKGRGRRNHICPGLLKACSAFFCCASILATASLIWLFIDVRQQLTLLRTEVDQAIAGSEDVPDALQKCHSLSKDLQKNQTILFTHLNEVRADVTNFTIQLSSIQQGLQQMQELLHGAPELTSVPKKLKEALTSVATFGSQIKDLQATVGSLKETNTKLQDTQNVLRENITDTKNSLAELSRTNQKSAMPTNETKLKINELTEIISKLKTDLSTINETLTWNYKSIQQEQNKAHKTVDLLRDQTQNASSKVLSLERSCANASEQATIISSVEKLTHDVEDAHRRSVNLTDRVQTLEQNYNILKNTTNTIINSTLNMKNRQQNINVVMNDQTSQLHNTTGNEKTTSADGLSG
ncbi:hypothetical protein PV325_005779 [Microctonus aethiopoides]|nr:hypothetical protein PV325_005779 [Microctonus aethiopoides]KAK0097617.1 hypothetical protein PV326_000664 [Microctonus aethiopoides]